MVNKLEELINISDLRSDYLKSHFLPGKVQVGLFYDSLVDTLMILFVPPEIRTVVHYVDEYVALLFIPETKDIVGLQVEDFERKFIPKYAELEKAWKLSDAKATPNGDFGDLLLFVEKRKSQVAHEVLEATESVLGQSARDLKDLLPA